MVTVLRPLTLGELLDRTFYLYRNNFGLFVGISAVPQLFVLALRLGGAAISAQQWVAFTLSLLLIGFANYVAIQISHAATVIAVSNLHLDHPVSIRSAYASAKGSIVRVFGIALAVGVAAGIGLILFIIPGVYLFLMWGLAIPVTILEDAGLSLSTARSRELTRGSRGRILVIYVLLGLLAFIVSLMIQWPMGFIAQLIAHRAPGTSLPVLQVMQAAGGFVSNSLVGPLVTIALTLVYYDLRVRKEGFDLELMTVRLQPGAQTIITNEGP
jgi:hypothetical protein